MIKCSSCDSSIVKSEECFPVTLSSVGRHQSSVHWHMLSYIVHKAETCKARYSRFLPTPETIVVLAYHHFDTCRNMCRMMTIGDAASTWELKLHRYCCAEFKLYQCDDSLGSDEDNTLSRCQSSFAHYAYGGISVALLDVIAFHLKAHNNLSQRRRARTYNDGVF